MWQLLASGRPGAVLKLPSGAEVFVHQKETWEPFAMTFHATRIIGLPLVATNIEAAKLEALHVVAEELDVLANDRATVERWLGGSP